VGDLTFHPDINAKSRVLDAQLVRGDARQPRYEELYRMTGCFFVRLRYNCHSTGEMSHVTRID